MAVIFVSGSLTSRSDSCNLVSLTSARWLTLSQRVSSSTNWLFRSSPDAFMEAMVDSRATSSCWRAWNKNGTWKFKNLLANFSLKIHCSRKWQSLQPNDQLYSIWFYPIKTYEDLLPDAALWVCSRCLHLPKRVASRRALPLSSAAIPAEIRGRPKPARSLAVPRPVCFDCEYKNTWSWLSVFGRQAYIKGNDQISFNNVKLYKRNPTKDRLQNKIINNENYERVHINLLNVGHN